MKVVGHLVALEKKFKLKKGNIHSINKLIIQT